MPKIKNPIRRLLDRLQNRFARSRPGSVLVLVVALLVLMALIGTAYITTARTDRFSAQQNALNTQIDLLLQGVINMAEATMTTSAHEQAGGQHWDDTRSDPWLSSRIPTTLQEACGAYVPGNTYAKGDIVIAPYDPDPAKYANSTVYISIMDGNITSAASPTPTAGAAWKSLGTYSSLAANLKWNSVWPSVSSPLAPSAMYEDPRYPLTPFPGHNSSEPGIVAIPTSLSLGGKSYPAFQFYDPGSGNFVGPYIAASASGDGIADAFLWRLPIGEINGVTYYAATRIVDSSAAINLNTALSNTWDFDSTGNALTSLSGFQLSPGIFPGNIGLAEMLKTFDFTTVNSYKTLGPEMVSFSKYRCNIPASLPLTLPTGLAPSTYPIGDAGLRMDFRYNTLAEAMFMGLSRRLNNPALFAAVPFSGMPKAPQFQALSWGDAAALAFKFDLVNANSSQSTPEIWLAQSLYTNINPNLPYPSSPYNPADIGNWFASFQSQAYSRPYDSMNKFYPQFCLRPFVTTHNPQNNLTPAQKVDFTLLPPISQQLMGGFSSDTNTIPRVSLNTADILTNDSLPNYPPKFPTLWLGFYNAMYAGMSLDNTGQLIYKQFRSSLRDLNGTGANAATFMYPSQQVALRSLIAAVNAKDLRDSDDNVASRTVQLYARVAGAQNVKVNVTVFGTERQPYITEIYANNDNSKQSTDKLPNGKDNPNAGKQNLKGYVAVELHNPYDTPIFLNGWNLGILTRNATTYPKNMAMTPIKNFKGFGAAQIPAFGYAVLENYQRPSQVPDPNAPPPDPNDAQFEPFTSYPYPNATAPTNVTYIYVPNLQEVFPDTAAMKPGGELYLLRPRNADGSASSSETADLATLVPADSFDFQNTGVAPAGPFVVRADGDKEFEVMHYVRANGIIPGAGGTSINNHWRFVYPGRWTPESHQEGIAYGTWKTDDTSPNNVDPWLTTPPGLTPGPNDGSLGANAAPINIGLPDPTPSYLNKFPAIQLNNINFGGPKKLTANQPYAFPYGGFARLGDVLQVPFIGAYTVNVANDDNTNGPMIEMNAVTTDSSFADDMDGGTNPNGDPNPNGGPDDAVEQIGRFCPLTAADPFHSAFNMNYLPVVSPPPIPNGVMQVYDTYAWAASVLDCFTVIENPHDDYTPNVDRNAYPPTSPPTPVPNLPKLTASTANLGREDLVPIEGLININTAPFAVLRRVPFVPLPANALQNDQIALAIVTYRNSNGPYRTLFDLNKVPGFQTGYGVYGDPSAKAMPPMIANYDTGDLSVTGPPGAPNDGVIGDFEKRFMVMTRVSNLLTTRSDTYTAYILVQGWRGVGTATPELVVQRRAAFIADRSGVTATNKSLNVINVQAN